MNIDATRGSDGTATATGAQTIKLTDFGIKPPSFFLGSLRVGNELKAKFVLKVSPAAVATAIAELNARLASATTATTATAVPVSAER
jgi:hypothetical protein